MGNEDTLAAAKQTISTLNQKVVVMQDRLQECSDYFELRTRNQVLVKENHQAKRNLTEQMKEKEKREKEHQRLVKELLKKMGKTSPDVEVLRENVTREVEERERKENELQGKITGLQERYNLEVSKNVELRSLYEDQILSQRELLRQIDEMKEKIIQITKENERLRNS